MKRGLSSLYHHGTPTKHTETCPMPNADSSSSLTFGTPLSESEHVLLLQLITYMHKFISSEGLFRKSGNRNRVVQLIERLESGELPEVVLSKTFNAHDFASVLKQYFSELPEPLLLKRHLNAYIQSAGNFTQAISRQF